MWTWMQIGKLLTPSGSLSAHDWYSGHAEHANVPADEGLVGLGPLPCGIYTLAELITHPTQLGPVAIHLNPDIATRAHIISLGRNPDSFYVHDGHKIHDLLASEGCLVSVEGTAPILDLWNSGDCILKVESGIVSAAT